MPNSAWHDESDDDDTPLPLMKKRMQPSESDDEDIPIRPKKISKPQASDSSSASSSASSNKSDDEDASDSSSVSSNQSDDQDTRHNTKIKLEAIKQDFFDVCLEHFEENEATAIDFFVNSMKEAIKANREIASITRKLASLAEQNYVPEPTRGVRQAIARRAIVRLQAEHLKKYGEFRFKN
jgi:hypothetical protein